MARTVSAVGCLRDDDVLLFASGRMPVDEASLVEEHLGGCSACGTLVAETANLLYERDPEGHLATTRSSPGDAGTSAGGDPPVHMDSNPNGATEGRALQPGVCVGRYQVLGVLGSGGMGVVYMAHDVVLRRRIALKVLRGTQVSQVRLLREARAMAQLSHPNVVAVHDVGMFDGQVFIAMELVLGKTLRQWLAAAAPSWQAVLDVLAEVGSGLSAAHAAGLIHGDLKPENLLVGNDGRVRVTDFGLARTTAGSDDVLAVEPTETHAVGHETAPLLALTTVTKTRGFSGTPAYMSPEQFLGIPASALSDQFAFCITVYEAVYGHRPFQASAEMDLAERVLSGRVDPPPPDSSVPASVRHVVFRGLGREPADRHPSMVALLSALREAARSAATNQESRAATVARARGNAKGLAAVAGAALAVGVGFIAWRAASSHPNAAAPSEATRELPAAPAILDDLSPSPVFASSLPPVPNVSRTSHSSSPRTTLKRARPLSDGPSTREEHRVPVRPLGDRLENPFSN